MPYYCTVPRCTSMAGKAKNVSFHQFPRDEEMAKLWNKILKRGKPYTKYSKVCSLHFRPEDYTITSVGKNKGQWRTLRKDAIPSQKLPSESPVPQKGGGSGWAPSQLSPNLMDPRMQQQMAQAIYVQTMLAMQAANGSRVVPQNVDPTKSPPTAPHSSNITLSDIEQLITKHTDQRTYRQNANNPRLQGNQDAHNPIQDNKNTSYKCVDCSKCFKDPDVFVLHRRTHVRNSETPERLPDMSRGNEKENFNSNNDFSKQETLRANPILANLLKSGMPNEIPDTNGIFDTNNILSIENQIMTALAVNMETYIRNLSSMLSQQAPERNSDQGSPISDQDGHNSDEQNDRNSGDDQSSGHSFNFAQALQNSVSLHDRQDPVRYLQTDQDMENDHNSGQDDQNFIEDDNNYLRDEQNSIVDEKYVPNLVDNEQDGQNLVVNEQDGQNLVVNEQDGQNLVVNEQDGQNLVVNEQDGQNLVVNEQDGQNLVVNEHDSKFEGSADSEDEPSCDNEDLNESKDSMNLVIDENLVSN